MRNWRTYLLVMVLALAGIAGARAQQEWTHSQYLFNLFDINSAYAGNHHALSTALRHRSQWAGVEGAPTSQSFTLHTPLRGALAGGFRCVRESVGARDQWQVRANAVYKIYLREVSLGFSIGGGMLFQQMVPSRLTARDANDVQLDGSHWRSASPLLDAAFFATSPRWFAGIEGQRLNRAEMGWSDGSVARSFLHLNTTAGYLLKLNDNDLLAFSGLVKWSEGGYHQEEVNLTWLWNNRLWLGAGYRIRYGMTFLAEWNITPQWRIGYAYDLPVGNTPVFATGSHELFLGFNLRPRNDRSIRYFG